MPTIKRTTHAEEDLIDIWLYIAHDDVRAADSLLDKIEEKFLLLADQSSLGPARPDIAPGLRYLPVRRYLILYRRSPAASRLSAWCTVPEMSRR